MLSALHARTREQGYTGQARWEYIAAVKDAVTSRSSATETSARPRTPSRWWREPAAML